MDQDEYTVETVKIVAPVVDGNPHGYVVINKSDLSDEHQLFGEQPQETPKRRGRPPKVH